MNTHAKHVETYDLMVCDECVQYTAYGELPADTSINQDEEFIRNIQENWPSEKYFVMLGDSRTYDEHSVLPCDCCGTKMHGPRHHMVAVTY